MRKNNLLKLLISLTISTYSLNANAVDKFKFQVINNTDMPLDYVKVFEGVYRNGEGGSGWIENGTITISSSGSSGALKYNTCHIAYSEPDKNCDQFHVKGSEFYAKAENKDPKQTFEPANGLAEVPLYPYDLFGQLMENWAVHFSYGKKVYKTAGGRTRCFVPVEDANKMINIYIEPKLALDKNKLAKFNEDILFNHKTLTMEDIQTLVPKFKYDGIAKYNNADSLQIRINSPSNKKDCIISVEPY
ncbi:MAG: hypothetical protein K0R94_176 [Burkholderiales bacterium]|jgi:hypothetical protein|nr:hypothetical protein [Burkholderiales bacterium]